MVSLNLGLVVEDTPTELTSFSVAVAVLETMKILCEQLDAQCTTCQHFD